MKKLLFTCLIVCFSFLVNAQSFENAIGIRGGYYPGITFQHKLEEGRVLEIIANTRYSGYRVTALYEFHENFENREGLSWYYGFGAHTGRYATNKVPASWGITTANVLNVGVDLIVGIQFQFPSAPLHLSFDVKPAFNFLGFGGFVGDGGGLALRYQF